ncbi:DNA cytosine methyltransferase [Leptospira interrogans]|uniref:DNA (cytosine-5-)-methyltransferase n=1 Tax=Leptospira interrogans serovar Canicola TaxID=211880 RepID=A0AAP9WDP2_LEPIR|nr:DNA cytosine methyltransferase [Leptospira interrogans]QOI43608.1 DNA cytosine methyltransferase [Leptospira interrogans serovar Canicola]
MRAIELFAGGGGLSVALKSNQINPSVMVEWDRYACATLRNNFLKANSTTEIFEGDIRNYDFTSFENKVELVTGGPPCQPFSLGGKHKGFNDERDLFAEATRAISEVKPKAFIFENVKGLTRRLFAEYFEYIYLQMTYPLLRRKKGESWIIHWKKLEKYHTSNKLSDLQYQVVYRVLNSADYGVPQKRERIFFVGFRSDISVNWSFPEVTHSKEALEYSKWVTGDYWEKHNINIPKISKGKNGYQFQELFKPEKKPWLTVRDSISNLPDPRENHNIKNHEYKGNAKQYKGHTGSFLDEPAKTIKAGVHGVPGGENMLVDEKGKARYFSVREAARIQTFPDHYSFVGSWTESLRQIGNAVPVKLAANISDSVKKALLKSKF